MQDVWPKGATTHRLRTSGLQYINQGRQGEVAGREKPCSYEKAIIPAGKGFPVQPSVGSTHIAVSNPSAVLCK